MVKEIYSKVYISDTTVHLVINRTNIVFNPNENIVPFVSIKVPFIQNYKQKELIFNVTLL